MQIKCEGYDCMLDYTNIVGTLLQKFRKLNKRYAEDIDWIRSTFENESSKGQTVYFDRCFCDYIGRSLVNLSEHSDELNHIFDFLEEMASSDDIEVQNLLQVTVLEYLGSWYNLRLLSEPRMGNATKEMFDIIKRDFHNPQPNQCFLGK